MLTDRNNHQHIELLMKKRHQPMSIPEWKLDQVLLPDQEGGTSEVLWVQGLVKMAVPPVHT